MTAEEELNSLLREQVTLQQELLRRQQEQIALLQEHHRLQQDQIAQLTERVKSLQERLAKDSHNSHLPPLWISLHVSPNRCARRVERNQEENPTIQAKPCCSPRLPMR